MATIASASIRNTNELAKFRSTPVVYWAALGAAFLHIGYFLPYNLFVLHADTFPAYPSYMRVEICGEGTKYACPSREWVPIPTRDSKIFVGPDDPRLPKEVRDAQGITASGKDPYASK